MERGLFVEDKLGGVAAIDIALAVGLEERIGLVYLAEIGQGHACVAVVVTYEPDVGILATAEHTLKGEGYGAALGVVAEDVVSAGIGNELCHGAAASRHIPCRAALCVEKYGAAGGGGKTLGECLQGGVLGLDGEEERVGLTALAEQSAVEAYPLRTSQC